MCRTSRICTFRKTQIAALPGAPPAFVLFDGKPPETVKKRAVVVGIVVDMKCESAV